MSITDRIKNLDHALLHLLNNKIAEEESTEGWYSGRPDLFKKRHIESIEMIQTEIQELKEMLVYRRSK